MSQQSWQENYADILKKVDAGYRVIGSMRPISEDVARVFYEEFSIAHCHNSNTIEGATFTFDETKLILKEGMVFADHSLQEHMEIQGSHSAFWFIYDNIKNTESITEDFIKHIHAKTLPGKSYSGQYRDINVYIGDAFSDRVTFQPPPPGAVPHRMTEYVQKINADLKILHDFKTAEQKDWNNFFRTMAAHHCDFEQIHPFVDGNGRTGRLLMNTEFIKLGILPIDIRYAEREHYYAALKKYDHKAQYSNRKESKTDAMAKLFAVSQLASVSIWLKMFASYAESGKQ
ncbi:MAG: Fic family protein [Firmicutes bacterium]|nr:Fic family protein [Bacillota bacterium]